MSGVIDLTDDSFVLADHYSLANTVIVLEDSITETPPRYAFRQNTTRKMLKATRPSEKKALREHGQNAAADHPHESKEKRSYGLGDCPICMEELGLRTIASTKCGHIFCLHCLEEALRREKRCPKCRHSLREASAYHPLYI